jgi:type III secretion protein T
MNSLAPFLLEAQTYLVAAAFSVARISGMLLVTPVFSRLGFTGLVRSSVGLALCVPLLPMIVEVQKDMPLLSGTMALLLAKEAVVGLLIGFVTAIPFWAAELAGTVLDTQRAATTSSLAGVSGGQTTVTGTLLTLVTLAIFFSSGGMHLTVGVYYESYSVWPLNQFLPILGAGAGDHILSLLDNIFAMGLMMVMPLVIALLLSDLLLGLLSRASPQLHLFDLMLNVKGLVFVVLLTLYWGFMTQYMEYNLGTLLAAKTELELIRGPIQH